MEKLVRIRFSDIRFSTFSGEVHDVDQKARDEFLREPAQRIKRMGPASGVLALFRSQARRSAMDVKVTDPRNCWASCTITGRQKFHWTCMISSPIIHDYIVVDDWALDRNPHYGRRLLNEVDRILPDYRERKERFRVNREGMGL